MLTISYISARTLMSFTYFHTMSNCSNSKNIVAGPTNDMHIAH